MAALRTSLRWSMRLVSGVAMTGAVVLAIVYALLRSGLLVGPLDGIITLLARKERVFFVRAEGVSGNLPEHLRVRKVEVGDATGVWLTIEDAEATWHPFDLFHPFDDVKWRINVDDIRAKKLIWTRLPHDEEVDDGPFRWDRFIRIIVGHLVVDDLELAGTLLDGQTSRVRAEGSGVLGEWDRGFVRLDIEHVDGVGGKARIDLKTFGSPVQLEGTVTAEEAPGGALAALARLDDAGAVRLDARGSGPMRAWHGEADVAAANVGELHAKTDLAFTAEGPFEVTGTFDPAPGQRERWLVGEGAPMSVVAKGAWAPDVDLRLERVELGADGRRLSAAGRLDLVSKAFEVSGKLAHEREGEIVRTTLVDVAGAKIEGRGVLGDGGRLEAVLDLATPSVATVAGRELRATLKATDPMGDAAPSFELAATAGGLTLEGQVMPLFGESARLAASGRVDLEAGVLAAERATLDGADIVVKGPVSFGDKWRSMNADLQAESASLESLTRVFATSVSGSARAAVQIAARSDWQDVEMKIRAGSTGVAIGEQGWNALVGGEATLEANLRGALRGPAQGDLLLKTTGIEASAKGQVGAGGEGLIGDARFVLDNLARLAEPTRAAIAGRLEASASARGSLDRFDLNATVRGDRFSWEGVRFDTLVADIEADGLPDAWSAGVRSRATYGKLEAALETTLSMPGDDRLVVRGFTLRGPRTQGSADLEIDLAHRLASGTLRLVSEELSLWRPMTGLPIGGAVSVEATLAAPGGAAASQQVSGTATVRGGVVPLGESDLFVDELDVVAQGLDLGPRPSGSARAHVLRMRHGERTLVDGLLTASGDGRQWNVETKLDVRDGENFVLDAAASVLPGPPIELTLARAAGNVGATTFELAEPAGLKLASVDAEAWSTGRIALRLGDEGRLVGQAERSRDRLRIDAQATALPLAVASVFSPMLDLEGSADGRIQLEGATLESAKGELSIRGHDVVSRGLEDQGVAAVDVQVDARFASGRVSAAAALAGIGDTKFSLTLDAPLSAASGSAPFVADLVWKGDLAETLALLPLGEDALSGRVDASLRMTGTLAAPRVTGRAVLDGVRWEQAASGLLLRDAHAEIEGSGTSLELRRLTATDGEKGTVSANGYLRFGQLPGFEAALDLEASDAMLTRLDLITTKADATIAVRASRSAAEEADVEGSITGNVRLDDVRIEIPQRFVSDVPEIEVIEVGADVAATAVTSPARRLALALDVSVTGDNRIFVTGRGLESEWSSDIHVRGDTLDPRIEGKVTSVRGQLSLLGRRFDVNSATLRFDGEKGNVPWLTLIARAEANDITAIADVTGPATRPTIELRSEPSLPRDEVLARVLFGQSAANLTPLQSVQLARGVAELTGSPLGGGGGLVSGIGRSLGFDRLDIGSGSDGAAALTASKYLTENVYLRVQGGLTPEDSKLSLEWRVFKHVTLESDVSQDAQGEVGATWRWDY